MKEIEVNEYARTKKGIIGELISETLSYPEPSEWKLKVNNSEIIIVENEDYPVKHSKQLIDLIEVKDVIKYRINNISTTLETKGYVEGIVDISDEEMLQKIKSDKNYHILEILTKEQYLANCYKVGEKDEC